MLVFFNSFLATNLLYAHVGFLFFCQLPLNAGSLFISKNGSTKCILFASTGRHLRTMYTSQGLQLDVKSSFSEERLKGVKLWVTVSQREKFTASELQGLKHYLDGGEKKSNMINYDPIGRNIHYNVKQKQWILFFFI